MLTGRAAIALTMSVLVSIAPAAAADPPATKPPVEIKLRGRVPSNYGKLDLTSDQKTRIYAIQNEYDLKIEALEAQLAELRQQRDVQIESVLSAGQRTELKKIQDEANAERARKAAEAKKAAEAAKKPMKK
jgi:Spy/CpxP family protein refolding chaperone